MNYYYFGQFFQETERIKKTSKRWSVKLKSMPVLERQEALLYAMAFVNSEMDVVYHRGGRL